MRHKAVGFLVCVIAIASEPVPRVEGASGRGQNSPNPMPIATAFEWKQISRENRLALAPDGKLVAYVVRDPARGVRLHASFQPNGVPVAATGQQLLVSDVESGRVYPASHGAGNCWRPSWSPDGTQLAMYCDGGGLPQAWVYDVRTRTSRRVSEAVIKPKLWTGDEPLWSPNGRELFVRLAPPAEKPVLSPLPSTQSRPHVDVFSTRRSPPIASGRGTATSEPNYERDNASLAAIDVVTGASRIVVPADVLPPPDVLRVSPSGRWIAYFSRFHRSSSPDASRYHDLAVVPATGGAVRLVASDILVSQSDYSFGTYAWHPSRDQLVWWKDNRVWTIDLDTDAAPRQLGSTLSPFTIAPMVMTRDGRAIVTGGDQIDMHDYRDPYPRSIAIIPLAGGSPRTVPLPENMLFQEVITASNGLAWQPEPDTLTVLGRNANTAEDELVRLHVRTGQITSLWKGLARVRLGAVPDTRNWAIGLFEDLVTPGNLYVFDATFSHKRRLTEVDPRLTDLPVAAAEVFETMVPKFDGTLTRVSTSVLLPPGAKRGDRLPAVAFLYPGSKLSRFAAEFGGGMPSSIPLSVFTARGYTVLLVELPMSAMGAAGNPVMEMVDALLPQIYHAAELEYIDLTRVAICGQSYGGYGAAAIITATNAFRASIAISGFYDLPALYSWMSSAGTPLLTRWAEAGQGRMGTHPWADLQRYLDNSPYYRADRIRTPLLMIQGEADSACPVEDARKMFNALKRLNHSAELRTYTGEGHVVYEWSRDNAVDAVTRMLTFLEENLQSVPSGAPRPSAASNAGNTSVARH